MKHRIQTILAAALLVACMPPARGQNLDTLPSLSGASVDRANDKILVRDASVSAAAGALRWVDFDEFVNVPGMYSTLEPALGNPGTNGYVLSSTTSGTRSWVAPGGTWGNITGTLASQTDLNSALAVKQASLSYTAADGPEDISWVAWFRANDVAGSDNTAITSITPTAGTSGAFTGTATLRTGANGINGQKALSFNGSSDLFASASGGLDLAGDFYFAAVVRFSSVAGHQSILSFGNQTTAQRRSLHHYPASPANKLAFVGQSADVLNHAGSTLATGTTYFLEISGNTSAGIIRIFVNGREESGGDTDLVAFSSAVLRIGSNPNSAERFSGLMSEAFFRAGAPAPADWRALRRYIGTTYSISINNGATYLPAIRFNNSVAALNGPLLATEASAAVLGEGDPIMTGGTTAASAWGTPARFSIHGNLAAYAAGAEHLLTNTYSNQNTLALWNKSPAGYSAIRFCDWEGGYEMAALGYGRDKEPWAATSTGSSYFETSNFLDPSKYGIFRLIQTKSTGNVYALRFELEEDGDMTWYNRVTHASKTQRMKLEESTGDFSVDDGNLKVTKIGKTMSVKSGSNAKAGTFTLSSGAATVGNTSVTANSVFKVTLKTASGTRSGVPDIVPNPSTGFTATGAATDNSTYNYVILEVN